MVLITPSVSDLYISEEDNDHYFVISKKLLDTIIKKHYFYPKISFTLGTVIIPAKFRFKTSNDPNSKFNFKPDVALGLYIGFKWKPAQRSDLYISGLFGFGPSLVQIDSASTQGKIQTNTSAGAYSISGGVVFEYKKAQIGVFTGADYASGDLSKTWIYNNKPWLAVGVGFNIYSVGAKKETDKHN